MNPVLRAFNAVVDDVDNAERSITAKVSTFSVDRHNTVFDARGCDLHNYNNNRVVLWEHSRDPVRGALPIGTNLWIKVDRSSNPKLIARTKFKKDDFSQQLFEAYRDNEMSGWSLSAIPTEYGPPTQEEIRSRPELSTVDTVFRKYDLCEYSAVAVPSCADALTIDELRSFSKLISRGIPLPQDVLEAVERLSKIAEERDAEEGTEDRMSSCDGASGGYLIKPEEKDEEDRDKPADDDEKKKKPEEDEKPGDEADGDEDDKPKGSERTIIELPDISGSRTFQQIYHMLLNDEVQHRELVLKKIDEAINWYHGKV